MSKSSNRSVRWFGTRVPLISRGILAIVTLLVALPLSGFIFIYFGYSIFDTNWLFPILLMLLVGTLSHIVFLLILNSRYKNPSMNSAFLDMIGRIQQRILVPSSAQVWVRQSNDAFITSTFNPIFDAVIVSEPMVDLILKRPEAGEVLLAFHHVRIPRKRWFGDYAGSLILFVILTYLSSTILVPLTITLSSMLQYGFLMLFSLASSFLYVFFIPIFIVLLLKGTFWRHEPAFMRITEAYGMHPQVAKVEVERGTPLIEEEVQSVLWGVREWEKKKRSARRLGLSTIAAIPAWIILIYVNLYVSTGYYPFNYSLYMWLSILPYIGAFLIGVLIYVILRRWDNNAMGEVFQETTDSHEPLWMD